MAELRRIGVRLTAEGVNQYKQDLREAGREARLMSQETRLAMAELGTGASATERFTTRLKGLGREYDVQQNRVRTLTNSQKEFRTSLNMVGREIKTTSSQLRDSQRETNRLENNYRKMGETLGWNARETKKAKAEWEASKNETKELSRSLNSLEKEQNQYTKELEKMPGKINSAKIAMQEKANEMARLREEYIRNGGALGDYADRIERTSRRLRTFSEGMVDVGDSLTAGVTVPIVAGVAATVKAASDWESAFAGTRKTVDEVVDANGDVIYSYEQLESELRNLSRQLPATHSEIAGVAEAAGQLGIETENVTSFTKTMIDMGESTNLSAEEAASSLARLSNITGMSQNDFDRLGSSIVALGNNFATTEAEIVQMGLRLAGTGNQIGMTESDILALATAMSSVGIQAEAGGTAMSTVLKRMQNAVADGSAELELFADVARMSASEFADAFRDDPARALQAFIEGLELSSDEGENLNAILGELGITGIRESDTLLRLAGNSELLGEALDMSGQAWEENTALAEEAAVRYETLESQLGMLRNEVFDIAIEFGGPFVTALREGVQAARPLLEIVSDMAQGFNELDEETQQTVIKMIALTAAAGPTLSVLGRVGQGAATAGDGLAWLVRKIGGLQAQSKLATPEVKNTSTSIEGLGTVAMTAGGAKGVGGFTAALGTALPWIAGIALALGAGYGAWKLWGESAYDAAVETEKFGMDVSDATDSAVTDVQNLSVESRNAIDEMARGSQEGAQAFQQAFTDMGNNTVSDIRKFNEEALSEFETLPPEVQRILEESYNASIGENEQAIADVEELMNQANEIFANAVEENRRLTNEETQIIENLYDEIAGIRADAAAETAEEAKAARDVLAKDMEGWSKEQLDSRYKYLRQSVEQEQDAYAEQQSILEEWLAEGKITGEEYEQSLVEIGKTHDEVIAQLSANLIEWGEASGLTTDQIKDELNALGLSYEEGMQHIAESAKEAEESMISSTENLAGAAKEATDAWNEIALDEKEGKFTIESKEAIESMAETQEGWDKLVFIKKNAELSSNADQFLQDVLQSNAEWYNLTWEEREATLTSNSSHQVRAWLIANDMWDGLNWAEQEAIILSNSTEEVQQALIDAGIWNNLSIDEKVLLTQTNMGLKIQEAMEHYGLWSSLEPEQKLLLAQTNMSETAEEVLYASDVWTNTDFLKKLAEIDTNAPSAEQEFINLLNQWTGNEFGVKDGQIVIQEQGMHLAREYSGLTQTIPDQKNSYTGLFVEGTSNISLLSQWRDDINGTPSSKQSVLFTDTNAPETQSKIDNATEAANRLEHTDPNVATSTNADTTTGKLNNTTQAAQTTDSQSPHVPTSTTANTTTSQLNNTTGAAQTLDSQSPYVPTSTNTNNTTGQLDKTTGAAQTLDRQYPYIGTSTNANSTRDAINSAGNAASRWDGFVSTIRVGIERFGDWTGLWSTGTPYLPSSGFSVLGDGGKREPYLTPQGHFGVSGSSDELHHLPKGTRIWPSRQSFKTSARNNDYLKQYLDQIPKFAKGGTIQNPYDGYTGLVGEAGPEIFQIAQGKVSITPITQGQRTKVLEQQSADTSIDLSNLENLMEQMVTLLAQGQNVDINIDRKNIARATVNAYNDENDKKMIYKQRGLAIDEY